MELEKMICRTPEEFRQACVKYASAHPVVRGRTLYAYGEAVAELVTGRGGARSGAGRKPSGDTPKVPYTIKIKPETRRRIDELKVEGFSLGRSVDEMMEKM